MHDNLALGMRRGRDRDRARPRSRRLPHAALPDPSGDLSGPLDADDLNVRPLWEAGMSLEERAELADPLRIADHDCVRVADRDGSQLDAVHDLGRPHLHWSQLGLVEAVLRPLYRHGSGPDVDASLRRAAVTHEPGGCDTCPIAGHLGARTVRVDDADRHVVALDRQHLDHAVRSGQVEAARRAFMD
jgi:hypothetical protein